MSCCDSCAHFDALGRRGEANEVTAGLCRRYAPQASSAPPVDKTGSRPVLVRLAMWPTVTTDDWCGEHKFVE